MNWISIFKEMPPFADRILLYSRSNGIITGKYVGGCKGRKAVWCISIDGSEVIDNDLLDFNNAQDDFITHWQLLPKEPTKDIYELD